MLCNLHNCFAFKNGTRTKNNKKQEDIGMVVVILLYIKVLNGDVAHVYIWIACHPHLEISTFVYTLILHRHPLSDSPVLTVARYSPIWILVGDWEINNLFEIDRYTSVTFKTFNAHIW